MPVDSIDYGGHMSEVVDFEDYNFSARPAVAGRPGREAEVFFDRRELDLILNLYALMVAAGEWRDYAIAHDRESCCFAVYRRTADTPLYCIRKTPKLARKQGAYAVTAPGGRVLKRGRSLAHVLKLFQRKRLTLVY
jgi:hypothetical protein